MAIKLLDDTNVTAFIAATQITLSAFVIQPNLANQGGTATKFLTQNSSNRMTFRTGAEVLSDIGGGAGTMSSWTVSDDSGGGVTVSNSDNLKIIGTGGIGTTLTGLSLDVGLKSNNISQFTNDSNYLTTAGTVTSTNGVDERIAVFSTASNINGSTKLVFDGGSNLQIVASSATLSIDDLAEISEPKIDFYQANVLSSQISVNKTANVNITTKNNAGNQEARFTIQGDKGSFIFNSYTATAIATGVTAINPNQNFYPVGSASDTTTDLAVDQDGNVVRTTQEATWKLTRAQVDALTTSSTGTTLLSAPGAANKFTIIEKVTFLIQFAYNGNQMAGNQQYEILQDGNVADQIAILNGNRVNDIAYRGGSTNTSGIYEHDTGYATLNRTYKPNTATTIRRLNTSALNTAITTMSIKMRYRVYDTDTF